MSIAVQMTDIVKRFPGVVANDGVNFSANLGEVHALLGENGAGKSTLSNVLTGLYRPDEGKIELLGKHVSFGSPRDALNAGIGMVHQHFRLVDPFTVAENVILGEDSSDLFNATAKVAQRVTELSEKYGMPVDPTAKIWQLSVGEQQRVEILKVLYRGAQILILDEPTAVLTPQESTVLFKTLRSMVAEGRTVIFISHKLDEVMAVSDRVTVLRNGKTVGTVETGATSINELARMMVGRDITFDRLRQSSQQQMNQPILEAKNICASDDRGNQAIRDLTLTLNKGEIVGVAGVSGNGQRELAEVLAGMRPFTSGSLTVENKPVLSGNVRRSIVAGIAHVPEDRLHTGLAASHSVESNFILKSYRNNPMSRFSILRRKKIRDHATTLVEQYDVKTTDTATPVRLLSGGNVQKVLLAREFSTQPKILIAASPTRGLDIGAIETVRARIAQAAQNGVAVLLISEDLEEIFALADRILVIYEGQIVGQMPTANATRESIGLLMGGIKQDAKG